MMDRMQFRTLYRQFLLRVVDVELLSAEGEPSKLLGQMATILLSFSFLVSLPVLLAGMQSAGTVAPEVVWPVEHFFISTTMAVVGLFAVLSWDSVFPDRRDVLVLAPLPVRARTLFLAKLAAMGAGLGVAVVSLNGISGMLYPLLFRARHGGFFFGSLRSLAAYWLTLAVAGIFLFGLVLTVQGVASHLLPRQLFLRVSAVLQIVCFAVIVCVYVLEPSLAARAALTAPANQRLLAWLPTYWFLGLFQQLNGSMDPAFSMLVRRAWIGFAAALSCTGITIFLSYLHTLRRIVEEPDILPGSGQLGVLRLVARSLDGSILCFTIRTLLRSRPHRMILSLYLGLGFAVGLIFVRSYLRDSPTSPAAAGVFLTVSILSMCVAAAALRTVFSMPIALKANWIFRLTALLPSARYAHAVDTTFLLLAVAPAWLLNAAILLCIWPWAVAVTHLIALGLFGVALRDLCTYGVHKMPFTCSYLPGSGNVQFGFWVFVALLPFLWLVGNREWIVLHSIPARIVLLVGLGLVAGVARWCARRAASFPAAMQFEEVEEPEIMSLGLPHDTGAWRSAP